MAALSRRSIVSVVVGVSFLLVMPLAAQDRPVVFVHGVASGPETWEEAAARLQSSLQIAPERAQVTWRNSLEAQGSELQARYGALPDSTIVVGHSLGGLVGRQWDRQHRLSGVITVGSPNGGAPIANHINEWAGFNASLFNAVGNAFYWLSGLSQDQWWWVYSAVQSSLSWGGFVSDFAFKQLFIDLGMQVGTPFVQEIYAGAPYLNDLNGGGNLGREASELPARVAIVSTMPEYLERRSISSGRSGPRRRAGRRDAGSGERAGLLGAHHLFGSRSLRHAGAGVCEQSLGHRLLALELRRVLVPDDLRSAPAVLRAVPAERRLRADVESGTTPARRQHSRRWAGPSTRGRRVS